MMEILHGLTGDEVTRRHFSKDGGGHKANDYQGLKERLLQQVGTKATVVTDTNGSHDDTSSGGGVGSGRKWLPFPGRKLMSNDFVVSADQVRRQVIRSTRQ